MLLECGYASEPNFASGGDQITPTICKLLKCLMEVRKAKDSFVHSTSQPQNLSRWKALNGDCPQMPSKEGAVLFGRSVSESQKKLPMGRHARLGFAIAI
jgi:hypothetical protein